MFLQPTRIVQRKGIEHAIELTRRLGLPARLVISHASGDEGSSYEKRVREFAELLGTPVVFESELIQDRRGMTSDGRKIYTLWDVYPHADLVTYPSTLEGFGNAFLEAIYFKRPVVVNNYSIFDIDIQPKGFDVIKFDGFITEATLDRTRAVLGDAGEARAGRRELRCRSTLFFFLDPRTPPAIPDRGSIRRESWRLIRHFLNYSRTGSTCARSRSATAARGCWFSQTIISPSAWPSAGSSAKASWQPTASARRSSTSGASPTGRASPGVGADHLSAPHRLPHQADVFP